MAEKEKPETWKTISPGCIVFKPGSAKEYRTGSWRAKRPTWDNKKCIKCGVCYIYCPEGCVTEKADGTYEANLDYCKGCGICAHECWPGAIKMVTEEE